VTEVVWHLLLISIYGFADTYSRYSLEFLCLQLWPAAEILWPYYRLGYTYQGVY